MSEPYIRLKNICKSFGTVQANKNVSIDVSKGEILALLGENGSGKSTLVNMLSGIYTPDSGEIEIGGKNVVFRSPKDAINAGIGMIHQHFKLIDVLTAAENIVIGQENSVVLSKKKMNARINELSQKYGISIDPDKKVYNMSVSEKQSVEIMKILYRGADVLILDEPTAVLTPQEIRALFDPPRNEGARLLHYHHHPQARGGNGDLRPRDGSPQGRINHHRSHEGLHPAGAYRNDGRQRGIP